MDCSQSGSSVHGILQARILEWISMPSSKGSSRPRDRNCVSCLLHWQAGSLLLGARGKWGEVQTPLQDLCIAAKCKFPWPFKPYLFLFTALFLSRFIVLLTACPHHSNIVLSLKFFLLLRSLFLQKLTCSYAFFNAPLNPTFLCPS